MPAHRDPKELDNLAVPNTTRRTYQSGINHYRRWGGVLPASIESLRQYLADHSKELKPTTLETRLAAISRFHREGGWDDPTRDPAVQRVMRGIRSEAEHRPRQAEPLLWHELQTIIDHLDAQIPAFTSWARTDARVRRAIRDRALLLLGWWGALRASDIAKLRVGHLVQHNQRWTLWLFGKGDRDRKGEEVTLPAGHQPCPHQGLNDWLPMLTELATLPPMTGGEEEGADPRFPVFPGIRHGSGEALDTPMDVRSITRVIQRRAAEAGLTGDYSSHSLRRGWAVSWAASMTIGDFMARGRWKSYDVAVRYQRRSSEYYRDQNWIAFGRQTERLEKK